jgi:hypothetical protein
MNSVSIRETVLIQGILKGMGHNSPCLVRTIKVSIPKLDVWEYVNAEVFEAPEELPHGKYEVNFDGRRAKVKKTFDGWVSDENHFH